eukprot:gene3210-13227_t
MLKVNIHIMEEAPQEAEAVLKWLCKVVAKIRGADHHDTLHLQGQLADVLRDAGKDAEGSIVEKELIEVGQRLVKFPKPLDCFRAVMLLSSFLASRDHLIDKASVFMANTFVVYRQKLGPEHRLTRLTVQKLNEVVERQVNLAAEQLTDAAASDANDSGLYFRMAEDKFRQALSIRTLILPEADHTGIVRGLADALFGQGKVHEAQIVLKEGNATKVTSLDAMPTAYLKFLNMRVQKYMDKRKVGGEGSGGEEEPCDELADEA